MATNVQFVGYVASPGTGVATTRTVTRSTAAGNLLVAYVLHQGNTSCSVTDNTGGTWVLAGNTNTAGAVSQRLASIWYRLNAPATTTVTATMGTSSALQLVVAEYSGVASFSAGGVAAFGGSGTVQTGNPASASGGDKLICGLCATFNVTPTLQTAGYSTPINVGGTGTNLNVTHLLPTGAASDLTPRWSSANSFGLVNAVFVGTPVTPPYVGPTANAGPDRAGVEPYSTITIAGSATAGTNPVSGISWSISPAGPVISNGTTATPSVYFPATVTGQTYTATMTVTDGTTPVTDTVSVAVLPASETMWDASGVEIPCQWVLL